MIIAAKTDGSDQQAIVAAIQQVLDNYDTIKANIEAHKSQFLWDSQEGVIKEIVEKYLG